MGWILCIVFVMVALGGIGTNIIKQNTEWNTAKITMIKRVHKLFAWLLLLYSFAQITNGVLKFTSIFTENDNLTILAWLNLGYGAVIIVLFEFMY